MRGKKSIISVSVCCIMFSLTVFAQFTPNNARRSGLGGTFIIDDMVDVLRYPVMMDFYKDDIQVTFNSPIIGIKGIGDMISLGVIANRGLLLDNSSVNSFYQAGSAALSASIAGAPQVSTQNLPHILLGLNLGVVKLGFDLFYEYAVSSSKSETRETPSTITTARARINHPGLISSALFGPENIPITVKFGIGFPLISGKLEAATITEVKSRRGIFMEGGGEVEIPVSELKVSAGADWIMESYAFAVGNADPSTIYTNNKIAFYGGCEGEVMTNGKWGAMYNLAIISGNTKTATDTTTNTSIQQTFYSGLENNWTSVWIFDEVSVRGGFNYPITTPVTYTRNARVKTTTKQQTTYGPLTPVVGAGIKKSVFQLDIIINPTNWSGLISGPAVGMVTATIMF